jgi:SAM-dependent methyltransferase
MQQNKYDDKTFFDYYVDMRESGNNANSLIEMPTIKTLIPDLKDKSVLDLGCGMGEMCKYYKSLGAKRVLGIDISTNMIDYANTHNKEDGIEYMILPLERLFKIKERFDVVISSLAFHYVEDFDALMKDVRAIMNPGATLIFSTEHPMATCLQLPLDGHIDKKIDIEGERYYLVKDYNRPGKREYVWNDEVVVKYRRNFEIFVNGLVSNGFMIDKLIEPAATEKAISIIPKYKYQYDRPYFLVIKCHI